MADERHARKLSTLMVRRREAPSRTMQARPLPLGGLALRDACGVYHPAALLRGPGGKLLRVMGESERVSRDIGPRGAVIAPHNRHSGFALPRAPIARVRSRAS